jgi:nicotinamide-nucleotide amidase
VPLEFNDTAWKEIQAYFTKIKRPIADSNRRQAFFPAGATYISNTKGTAPGFYMRPADCLIVVLPGPPHELKAMVESTIVPMLPSIFGEREPVFTESFRSTGIGESTLASMLEDIFPKYDQFGFSSLFSASGVDIIITAQAGGAKQAALIAQADKLGRELEERLGSKFYGRSGSTLEGRVGELLSRRLETISVAESLTGGLIGKRLTDVPGSSNYFLADVVAYSNPAKMDLLGVAEKTLIKVGAVSEQVAAEMARGIRQRTGASWGLSTTGIAGPDGGSPEKPTGLCYYGLAWAGGVTVKCYEFPGSRELVRERVTYAALALLFAHLRDGES